MALGLKLGLAPWALAPILTAVTVLSLILLGRRLADARSGILAGLLYAFSAFTLFNGASYFNHAVVALYGVALVASADAFEETPGFWKAVLMGAVLGLIGLTRHYSAILFLLPCLPLLCRSGGFSRIASSLAGLALGAAPFLLALFGYNFAITGDPLLPPQLWYNPDDTLGFKDHYAPLDVFERAGAMIMELAEWNSGSFVILYFLSLTYLVIRRRTKYYDYLFIVFFIGFLLYSGTGGNRFGPRYIFDAFPFAVFTCARAFFYFTEDMQERRPVLAGAAVLYLMGSCLAGLVAIPLLALRYVDVVDQRRDLYLQAEALGLRHAVVFVTSRTGMIRSMPIGDLMRNGIEANGPVLYVNGRNGISAAVRKQYPDRGHWIYSRAQGAISGQIRPLK